MPEDIDSPDETDSINIICSRVPKIATWQKRSRLIKFELPLLLETNSIEFKQLFLEVSTIGFRTESYEVEYSFSELDGDGRIQLYVSQLKCPIDSDSSVLNETPIKLLVKVASDTKEVARKEFSIRLLPPVSINASVASAYSVVFHQNQIPLISSLEITNNTDEVYDLVKIKAEFDPSEFKDDFWNIEQLGSSQTVQLNERSLKLSANALTTLKERKIVTLTLSITTEDEVLGLFSYEIELLPKHQWGGERNMPELLAAFITPNTYYTDSLLKKASNMLGKDGHKSGIDGYQSGTRERPWMVAAALWAVVSNEGISYSVPPSSFASNGQKIRTNSEISKTLLATCLDTALLFASCLEQAGLNPVIALTKGHALVGCWLKDESFPNITNDDPSDLRNRIALDDIILFETTLATNDRPVQFKQAIKEGSRHISEDSDDDFVYVIDLKQARSRKINPIDTGDDDSPIKPEAAERPKATLPPPPVLPPINDHDADKEELSPEGRVDQWRRKLLDLSKRNRLLNISQRSTGFRIICPDLGTLEDNLAAGKKYNIVSKEVIETEGRSSEQFTLQTGDHLESEVVKDQLKRQNLVANCSERDLDKDLINLFRRAKSDLEEGGANTLFLTLGMLKWRVDGNSERYFKAPLILLPIKLARTSARAKPKIMQLPDESPVFNTTLIELMLQDYEIDLTKYQTGLPKDESGIDVQRVWSEVRSKIVGSPGFEVTEELFLSNFSFSKYLMWKDLSDRIDELKKSKLVNHLVEKPNETYADLADFRDAREVDKIDPSNLYAPLNADSAQIVAIDASDKGADFVLEGPPGTGKSETISNIIAHNLALGKKVLFVSEKMAALDVVYSRLKKVGLGHACLELHSKKATKKEVISQLKDAWIMRESASVEEWQQKAATLKKARGKLNSYVDELHKESHLGFTPFQAVARHVNKGPFCQVKLDWGDDLNEAPVTTPQEFIGACLRAKNLGLAYKDVVDIDTQGLELINISDWSFVWQSNLKKEASVLKTNTEKLTEIVSAFAREFGVSEVGDIDYHGAYYWCNIASICLKAPENSIAYAVGSDSTKKLEGLKTLAQLKDSLNELLTQYGLSIGDNYIEQLKIEPWEKQLNWKDVSSTANEDLDKALHELYQLGIYKKDRRVETELKIAKCMAKHTDSSLTEAIFSLPLTYFSELKDGDIRLNALKVFTTKWKVNGILKAKGFHKIKALAELGDYSKSSKEILRIKSEVVEDCLRAARQIADLHSEISALLEIYEGDGTLDQWDTSTEQIRKKHDAGISINKDFKIVAQQVENSSNFIENAERKLVAERSLLEESSLLDTAKSLIEIYTQTVESLKSFQEIGGSKYSDYTSLTQTIETLDKIAAQSNDFNAWCHWIGAREDAENNGLSVLAECLESGIIHWKNAEDQFQTAFYSWSAPLLIDASPTLREFSASRHDSLIQDFRELDDQLASTTGNCIAAILAGGRPDTTGPNAPHEYGVLSREIQRQRGHKPIRQLISELGDSLLELTPCFMMSPLSVAQYLPTEFESFDLVVFDEASQITVWDAVGAIARGKNVIVVGDPKQMPPTNFFNRAQDTDDSDEEDLESILDQAMAARVSHHRLTGHYRSRHESLIAFSNNKYYQNSLTTYPSPETKASAVTWHRVDGLYSRGKEKNNPIEAKAVVDEVIRRLNDPVLHKLSIGIVAMNSEQQRLIENLLDDERRADPKIERFFRADSGISEPIFVKNLETVQGDQRDVIFLSIGFGPTEIGAQTMSMNFGPLNRQGGERRLNVAITRASTEMLIFTSFDPSLIDLSRTSAEAVKNLKSYIEYADRGPIALAQEVSINNASDQFDSAFEEAVARDLRAKGWKLKTQIGVSKFRIDLGVLHPDEPGSFLVGIECDGATYHSSPSARDRDRVRHIILENLGWTLIRIWSTDYFINPQRVIDKVHHQLQSILEEERTHDANEDLKADNTKEPEEISSGSSLDQNITELEDYKDGNISPEGERLEGNQDQSTEVIDHDTALQNPLSENYVEFPGGQTSDPRVSPIGDIANGLLPIIEKEGPMIAKRAYHVYLKNCGIKRMGRDLKKIMNKSLQSLIRRKLVVKEDEWEKGGLVYSIIRTTNQPRISLRDKGPRVFEEIPPSEVREASNVILSGENYTHGSEKHFRAILNLFGFKRLTSNIQETLASILND